jgi:hypothetical protein
MYLDEICCVASHQTFLANFVLVHTPVGSRISSGSVVFDYGLDDRTIGVRSPAGAQNFSSILCVQTGSGVHPASSPMGTGGPFPGGKARPGRDAEHSPPSSAQVVNEEELYLLSPQAPPWRVAGLLYFYFYFTILLLHEATQDCDCKGLQCVLRRLVRQIFQKEYLCSYVKWSLKLSIEICK